MDEEELEQPRKKITISNFFESIQSIDKVANRALKKTESNLGIISENKSLIEALSKSFDNIITEVREIKEYVMIKDEDKDKLFSQEDQEQKIKRLERLQGLGDKPSKDDKDFKKQAAETVKKALQDPNIMQIFTGLIGLSVSGLLGVGASALGMTNSKNTVTQDRGFLGLKSFADILTLGLSDFDQMGRGIIPLSKEKKEKLIEKPRGLSRIFGGVADLIMRDTTDFDKRGSESTYKSGVNKEKDKSINIINNEIKKLDDKENEKLVSNNLAPKEVKKKDNRTFEEKFLDEGINDTGIFKVEKILKERKEKNQEDKIPNFKFGTEIGGVDGPDGVDRIPAMLTKGETVLSKDESENLKEMGVFNVDKLVEGLKKMFSEGKETTRSLQNLSDEDYYYLGLAVSGEATLNSDDVYGVVASILNRVSSKQYKNTVKDVVLSSDTADGQMEYQALNIMDVNNPNISKEVKNFLQGDKENIIKDLKSEKGQKGIIEAIQILDGRTNYKGQSEISNRIEKEDPMFDPKGNFFHYNFQETPTTLRNATEEQKNYRPPTIEDFVKEIEPKPTGLMRVVSGVLDAVTGDKYDFDSRSSDNLQSVIESKSNQLAENIFTPPSTENNKINLLPIPMNQQQSQPTDGNVIVAAPKNTPQVTTTPVESTISSVSFVNMISNKELSIG